MSGVSVVWSPPLFMASVMCSVPVRHYSDVMTDVPADSFVGMFRYEVSLTLAYR